MTAAALRGIHYFPKVVQAKNSKAIWHLKSPNHEEREGRREAADVEEGGAVQVHVVVPVPHLHQLRHRLLHGSAHVHPWVCRESLKGNSCTAAHMCCSGCAEHWKHDGAGT